MFPQAMTDVEADFEFPAFSDKRHETAHVSDAKKLPFATAGVLFFPIPCNVPRSVDAATAFCV